MRHVIVERMPEWLRASHEAAGNSGAYPHNGAERVYMSAAAARASVEADPEWTSIVRPARRGDSACYEHAE